MRARGARPRGWRRHAYGLLLQQAHGAVHSLELGHGIARAAQHRDGEDHGAPRTIAEHGYEIYSSKAAKIRDQVTDTFYLKDAAGKKLADDEAIERLRRDLLEAAQAPAEA